MVPSGALVVSTADLRTFADTEGLIAVAEAAGVSSDTIGKEETGQQTGLIAQIKALPANEHDDLWRRVLKVAGDYLSMDKLLPGGGLEVDPAADRVIAAVATLLSAFAEGALDCSRDATLPEAFAEVASICQEMLLMIPNGRTQSLIARALERICTDSFQGREDFFGGILMFLIGKCLEPRAASADVTRLYKVRDLFGELDWEHESIESLKVQLMHCIASPNFVRSHHGPDMLSLFYTVHAGFTSEVHGTAKNQVMYARGTALKSYAVSLFKAWKMSAGGTRVQIEHCVQEWAALAIRSARKSADRARAMLEEFHRHRHADEPVNELLCRIYGPLLWRCLKVANWQVRENAARLLQYTFALCPRELNVADREQELNRQLRLLRETLEDPSEPVRRVGCSAVCLILKTYWDIMPPGDTAELLSLLANGCAQDKKAPMVRAAIAEGFSWILDNPKSHPAMETVLPRVADMMNDKSPLVRAAFVCLLSSIQRCKGFSISTIISNEQLFMRLAHEHTEAMVERSQKGGGQIGNKKTERSTGELDGKASPEIVARRLAQLIAPSLFQSDIAEQVRRCTYMMTAHPLTLLALLVHARSIVSAPSRVKLAAALFHLGLRDATVSIQGSSQAQRHRKISMLLRVVGVLLEGASEPAKRARKKGTAATGRFPKELENFVYGHIKEENFLPLLQASGEGDLAAASTRDHLLFAISSLDPSKLPNTIELVRHELMLACRGAGEEAEHSFPRLPALLNAARRWAILDDCLEPAWERLLAASMRLKQRQQAAGDTASAVRVVEAVLRDPDVRSAVMPCKEGMLQQIVQSISAAFSESWTCGLRELQRSSRAVELKVMGPAATIWPRMLGLAVRMALHLEHRLEEGPAKVEAAREVPADGLASDQSGDAMAADAADAPLSQSSKAAPSLSERLLAEMGQALTCDKAAQTLEALEAIAGSRNDESSQPARKRARGAEMPADVDVVIQLHGRLLEALNAANFLSVTKRGGGQEGMVTHVLARDVEQALWRWASAADVLQPLGEGQRLTPAWVLLGRNLHQMAHADTPTPHVIEALIRLLLRVSDETPATDDELKRPLQVIFTRMEFDPVLVKTVMAMLPAEDGEQQDPIEVHARVRKALMDLIPHFRNLRARLLPEMAEPEAALRSPGQDKRRILASPTPQKGSRGQQFLSMTPNMLDGEPMSLSISRGSEDERTSLGRRSFSVRSRSPPPAIDEDDRSFRQSLVGAPEQDAMSQLSELDESPSLDLD